MWYAKLHFHNGRMVLGKVLHADPSCRLFNLNELHIIHRIDGPIVEHMPKCKNCARDVGAKPTVKHNVVSDALTALQFVRDLNNSRSGALIHLTVEQLKKMKELLLLAIQHEESI